MGPRCQAPQLPTNTYSPIAPPMLSSLQVGDVGPRAARLALHHLRRPPRVRGAHGLPILLKRVHAARGIRRPGCGGPQPWDHWGKGAAEASPCKRLYRRRTRRRSCEASASRRQPRASSCCIRLSGASLPPNLAVQVGLCPQFYNVILIRCGPQPGFRQAPCTVPRAV
jgi:hypothetical protein